ncbi:2,3-diaminopropionate biosynthesis protein SbnA [Fulvivirga kasyanovii]|uniref:2,3-diaminopropionate biosynthesis protein SbnA n=1 Tax=Fulvivirga kasyanovii TaxID=396812 RepID=UPI0031E3334F
MLKKLDQISKLIGKTPSKQCNSRHINLFAKLEYYNYTGSIKDRAAFNIVKEGVISGDIDRETVIIESSSGNFAIALATLCGDLGIEFIPVIDPNINSAYEQLLRLLCKRVIKVSEIDSTGGYLLTRIATVKAECANYKKSFWTNQYANANNYLSYYKGLGNEICEGFDRLDYLFIGVSSGGTITGVSRRIKEKFPKAKVVAVDVEGSVIFGGKPKKRWVSGIGASMSSTLLKQALIDEVIHISHDQVIESCHSLMKEQNIFAGASSGAVYAAVKNYVANDRIAPEANVLFICPDRGNAYLDTIYNRDWQLMTKEQQLMEYSPL